MIEIIEKEPFKDFDVYNDNRICLMYPVMMIKNDTEYFIFNRREPQESYRDDENKKIINQLKENNGMFVTFYSPYQQPIEFLKNIVKNEYTFDKVFTELEESTKGKFTDFSGNLNEISSAFMYRIYDTKLIEDIKEIIELINNKEWKKAESEIQIKGENYKQIELKEREGMEQ